MIRKNLAIIIPSYRRKKILQELLEDLTKNFRELNFSDYEILVVESGDIEENKNTEKIKFIKNVERLYPGKARNLGLDYQNANWIWFIDDDDSLYFQNLNMLIDVIKDKNNQKYDLITHSLKKDYNQEENLKNDLITNISLFKEKQEVFNHIFNRRLIDKKIKFSDGYHEDIRFVVESLHYCKSIKLINEQIYKKKYSEHTITHNLSEKRIDGYLNSIEEILGIQNDIIQENIQNIVVQCIGTILYLIEKCKDRDNMISYLDRVIPDHFIEIIPDYYNQKNTNYKFAASLFKKKNNNHEFLKQLEYCFRTKLSCKDLRSSLFLGPGEIIGCCKRFFYKNKMKGDIVLMKNSSDIDLEKINHKKKEIEQKINKEMYEDCEGCPYIERFSEDETKIDYISLENFTFCNMRCSYCSPKYYGGKEAEYETVNIVDEIIDGNHLSKQVHVVWGGGEPTLKPKFNEITEKFIQNPNVYAVRILSNGLKFSEKLNTLLKSDKVRLVTSIDAGTQEKFTQIRGKGQIRKVLENLSVYKKNIINQENLTLKYIFTEDNFRFEEIENFVSLISEYKFYDNFIQLSCNFKMEKPKDEIIISIYEMATLLHRHGFRYVYFDDLIRDRLVIDENLGEKIINNLTNKVLLNESIFHKHRKTKVILWGDGYQSKWIKNSTAFGRSEKLIGVVSEEKQLEYFSDQEYVICPSGIQSLPDIFKKIKSGNNFNKMVFGIFI